MSLCSTFTAAPQQNWCGRGAASSAAAMSDCDVEELVALLGGHQPANIIERRVLGQAGVVRLGKGAQSTPVPPLLPFIVDPGAEVAGRRLQVLEGGIHDELRLIGAEQFAVLTAELTGPQRQGLHVELGE
jgi:hypothetical protein